MGPQIANSYLAQAAPAPEDAPLVAGIPFKDRVLIVDKKTRELGLKLMAPQQGKKKVGLSEAQYSTFREKLESFELGCLVTLCKTKEEDEVIFGDVPEDLRKLLWSVFTVAPADQLVPPCTYVPVKILSESDSSMVQMSVSDLTLLDNYAPVLSKGFRAALDEARLPAPARSLLAHLVKVAGKCYPHYLENLEGVVEVSETELAASAEDASVVVEEPTLAETGGGAVGETEGGATVQPDGLQVDEVTIRDPGLRDLMTTGQYFGHRHGIRRPLRRWAMDSGNKSTGECCKKFAYNAKKRTPGM